MRRIEKLLEFVALALVAGATVLGAEGIRVFNLEVRGLVYDRLTERIYATSAEGLVQIDADSGAVLRTFTLGTNLSEIELGADGGLWLGVDGEGAVRRFNLRTFEAEDAIVVRPGARINDLSPSKFDAHSLAVAFFPAGSDLPEGFLVRNGTVLPLGQRLAHVALETNVLLGQAERGNVQRYWIDEFGIGGPIAAVGALRPMPLVLAEDGLMEEMGWSGRRPISRWTCERCRIIRCRER